MINNECKNCEHFKIEVVRDCNGNSLKTLENCLYKGECIKGDKFLNKLKTINCNNCKHKLTVMALPYNKHTIEKNDLIPINLCKEGLVPLWYETIAPHWKLCRSGEEKNEKMGSF